MRCEMYHPEPKRPSENREAMGDPLRARLIRARARLPKTHPRYQSDEPIAMSVMFVCNTEETE